MITPQQIRLEVLKGQIDRLCDPSRLAPADWRAMLHVARDIEAMNKAARTAHENGFARLHHRAEWVRDRLFDELERRVADAQSRTP